MQSMAVSAASTVGTASASIAGATTAAAVTTAAAATVSTTATVVSNAIRICRVHSSESYTSLNYRNLTTLLVHH